MAGVQCPSCNKLAGLDEPELEDSGVEVDGTTATITATVIRNSACCGDEIKRAELEGQVEIEHDCANEDIIGRTVYDHHNGSTFEIEEGFDGDNAEPSLETYVSGGGRYAKSYVGVEGSFTVKCKACGEDVETYVPDKLMEIAAGDMDVSV